jgi:hypothetical protein
MKVNVMSSSSSLFSELLTFSRSGFSLFGRAKKQTKDQVIADENDLEGYLTEI